LLFGCSNTKNLRVSIKEINNLCVIYSFKKNHYLFDEEWKFYEKNICQYSLTFIRKETHTGTWSQKNDTIVVSFFQNEKNIPKSSIFIIDDNGKLKTVN
jgi:hypothetical protein